MRRSVLSARVAAAGALLSFAIAVACSSQSSEPAPPPSAHSVPDEVAARHRALFAVLARMERDARERPEAYAAAEASFRERVTDDDAKNLFDALSDVLAARASGDLSKLVHRPELAASMARLADVPYLADLGAAASGASPAPSTKSLGSSSHAILELPFAPKCAPPSCLDQIVAATARTVATDAWHEAAFTAVFAALTGDREGAEVMAKFVKGCVYEGKCRRSELFAFAAELIASTAIKELAPKGGPLYAWALLFTFSKLAIDVAAYGTAMHVVCEQHQRSPACANDAGSDGSSDASKCPALETDCGGSCVYLKLDPKHCGACGNACTGGKHCIEGACVCGTSEVECGGACLPKGSTCGCESGKTRCGDACVDLSSDLANCGACGTTCSASKSCVAGKCTCDAGFTECSGICTNTSNDKDHCGGCGSACTGGKLCTGGKCACPSGTSLCSDGVCKPTCMTCSYKDAFVTTRTTRPTGAGSCSGAMNGYIKNTSSEKIYCTYCFFYDGKCNGGGGTTVAAGAEVGGPFGGIWTCGTPSSATFLTSCFDPTNPVACSKLPK